MTGGYRWRRQRETGVPHSREVQEGGTRLQGESPDAGRAVAGIDAGRAGGLIRVRDAAVSGRLLVQSDGLDGMDPEYAQDGQQGSGQSGGDDRAGGQVGVGGLVEALDLDVGRPGPLPVMPVMNRGAASRFSCPGQAGAPTRWEG